MDINQEIRVSQEGRLAMTFRLSQALKILQMSQLELKQLIQEEIEKNPLLEEIPPKQQTKYEFEPIAQDSLHENLQRQIRENFSHAKDRELAQKLIEYLDEKGFLSGPIEEIDDYKRILPILQTFHPPGIFARNLQESLLLQLKSRGEAKTHAYLLVRDYFDDFIHGRFGKVKKQIEQIDLSEAIKKLASLQMRPLTTFKREIYPPTKADLIFKKLGRGWKIQTNNEDLPHFQILPQYKNLKPIEKEEQQTLHAWFSQAHWLQRSLSRRRKILLQIGIYLIRRQEKFLLQKGNLTPLTMHEIAYDLELHESTISRAISNKHALTPRGLLPIKSLITSSPQKISIKETLKSIIDHENKQKPFTDGEIVQELQKKGHTIARRTVVKYRSELKILAATMRKQQSKN